MPFEPKRIARLALLALLAAITPVAILPSVPPLRSPSSAPGSPSSHPFHPLSAAQAQPFRPRRLLQLSPYQQHVHDLSTRKRPWYQQVQGIADAFSKGWSNAMPFKLSAPRPAGPLAHMGGGARTVRGAYLADGDPRAFLSAEPPPAPLSHHERKHLRRHPAPHAPSQHELQRAVVPQTRTVADNAVPDKVRGLVPAMESLSAEAAEGARARAAHHASWHRAARALAYLDMQRVVGATVAPSPVPHLFIDGFLKREPLAAVNADFPLDLSRASRMRASDLQRSGQIRGSFRELLHELTSEELQFALATIFEIPLTWLQRVRTQVDLFGQSDAKDARVRADPPGVLLTVEVYLSEALEDPARPRSLVAYTNARLEHSLEQPGHLRLLATPRWEDPGVQIPSVGGNMVAYKNPNAFRGLDADQIHYHHGGEPYFKEEPVRGYHGYVHTEGQRRRMVQVQYVIPPEWMRDGEDGDLTLSSRAAAADHDHSAASFYRAHGVYTSPG